MPNNLKIYEIDFVPMWPVPCGLIVLAETKAKAMKIAKETIKHTSPKGAKLIKSDTAKVIFYESGEY